MIKSFIKRIIRGLHSIAFIDTFVTSLFTLWYGFPPRVNHKDIVQNIETLFSQHYRLPFEPTHFYSPLPNVDLLKMNLNQWYKEGSSAGIDWNIGEQLELLAKLNQFKSEIPSLPDFNTISADGYGLGYGEVEAHLLYMMIRHMKPKKIIEVGSGVSSFFILNALQENQKTDGTVSELICIEPFPKNKLKELAGKNELTLHPSNVQNMDISFFQELAEKDILFIDSSHVSKKNSDVDFLYLEVLPNLSEGVIIQIHDIPFPYPSIPKDHWLFDTFLFWNEPALVKAFLLFNKSFKILMCQSFLHYKYAQKLKEVVELYDPLNHFPSSLWLTKTN